MGVGRVILSSSMKEKPESKLLETPGKDSTTCEIHILNQTHGRMIEQSRKEELINCTCGFMEEDGLMIQCDLCLCWQHGICNNIEKESDVPEKYVCPICLNPYRQRKSKKYIHDQDWLKEGKLPSLSFRSKNETNILHREAVLKRSHDLTGSLLQIQQVLHSLRVKVNIAGKPDHPKLYLWAKSWEKDGENSNSLQQSSESQSQMFINQKHCKMDKQEEIITNNDAVIEDNVETTIEVTDSDVTSAPEVIVKEEDSKPMEETLTNGNHTTNSINNNNLRVTEARPAADAPVPVPEPPRAPQPEAPIDPVECRLLLLDHIDHFQQQIDTRLTMLEEQVAALESQDPDAATDEAHDHYPQTKQAVQMLLRDLLTMRKIAALTQVKQI
ncbi:hypothetical protein L9F63_004496, partial [Diploptera punctata]